MPGFPFNIPPSLASYLEQYEANPRKTTARLKKQVKKRGPDAVGYFLLAWFYHLQAADEKAIECALKAKIFAPGSPFFEKLHYYFSHPALFEAWSTPSAAGAAPSSQHPSISRRVFNLDGLIEKLSNLESKSIKPDINAMNDDSKASSFSKSSDQVDDIVSETLAGIHEKQGKTEAAIRTYKKLKTIHTEKKDFYDKQIRRLKKMKKEGKEE